MTQQAAVRHKRGGLYFEDFIPGETVEHRYTRTVTQMDNMLFSNMTLNPQPLHIDRQFCEQETEWGQPLMNSLFTLGLMIGIQVSDMTVGTTIANLGMTEVKFPHPLFENDTVHCTTEIIGKRESKSRPGAGIVEFHHRAYNQNNKLVAECRRQAFILMRPKSKMKLHAMKLNFATLDVFTTKRFAGNPLGVVFDADGIDGATMQVVAREFNHPETVFVLKPKAAGSTAGARIFTPGREMPFAGHPTVGTALVLTLRRGAGNDVVLEEKIGPVHAVSSRKAATMAAQASSYRPCQAKPVPPQAARRSRQRSVSRSTTSASTAINRRDGPPAMLSRSCRCAASRRCGAVKSWMPAGAPASRPTALPELLFFADRPRISATTFTPACSRRRSVSAKTPPPARPPRHSPDFAQSHCRSATASTAS